MFEGFKKWWYNFRNPPPINLVNGVLLAPVDDPRWFVDSNASKAFLKGTNIEASWWHDNDYGGDFGELKVDGVVWRVNGASDYAVAVCKLTWEKFRDAQMARSQEYARKACEVA